MKFTVLLATTIAASSLTACGGGSANENSATTQIINGNPTNSSTVVPIVPVNGQGNANGAFPRNGNVQVISPAAPKPLTFPAPDNSEYSATMESSGVAIETRVFHSDKTIAKVVRTTRDPQNKTIAIYLRSGKVVNLAGDKWPEIRSIPLSAIYEAAGLKMPAAQPQPNPAGNSSIKTKPIE